MAAVEIEGLDAWRRRLDALGEARDTGAALRTEAEAIAAAARASLEEREVSGELARSVEIIDESEPGRSRYAIGTADPAGWHLEHGTTRRRGRPWLGPAFRAGLPAINHAIRKMLAGTLKALGTARS
jgi:hypothetical protein